MLLPIQMAVKQIAPSATDLQKICNILVETLKELSFLKKNSLLCPFLRTGLGVAFPDQSAVQVDSQVSVFLNHFRLFTYGGGVWLTPSPPKIHSHLFCFVCVQDEVIVLARCHKGIQTLVNHWYTQQRQSISGDDRTLIVLEVWGVQSEEKRWEFSSLSCSCAADHLLSLFIQVVVESSFCMFCSFLHNSRAFVQMRVGSLKHVDDGLFNTKVL